MHHMRIAVVAEVVAFGTILGCSATDSQSTSSDSRDAHWPRPAGAVRRSGAPSRPLRDRHAARSSQSAARIWSGNPSRVTSPTANPAAGRRRSVPERLRASSRTYPGRDPWSILARSEPRSRLAGVLRGTRHRDGRRQLPRRPGGRAPGARRGRALRDGTTRGTRPHCRSPGVSKPLPPPRRSEPSTGHLRRSPLPGAWSPDTSRAARSPGADREKRTMRVDIATYVLLTSGCGRTEKAGKERRKQKPS